MRKFGAGFSDCAAETHPEEDRCDRACFFRRAVPDVRRRRKTVSARRNGSAVRLFLRMFRGSIGPAAVKSIENEK
ncbi:MAG TPA: hypothetical protein PKX76_05455 [Flexilinea sp.]|nr:hypothetical protein [Flexilinea sp.]